MIDAKFVWEKMRRINRLPGTYALWQKVVGWRYRNGRLFTLAHGPAAGLRWRHYSAYQKWMAMGLYEPHVAQLIHDTLQPGNTFYDIGGNAGYFTLVGGRRVGPEGRVYTFDPLPQNAATIQEQIQLNHFEAFCHVETVAIAEREDRFTLIVPPRHSTANAHLESLAPHVDDEGERLSVLAITLDAFVKEHPRPDLVKIDIEGAEVAALQGARALLTGADAPILLVSTHSDALEASVRALLDTYGYTFQNLSGFDQMIVAHPR